MSNDAQAQKRPAPSGGTLSRRLRRCASLTDPTGMLAAARLAFGMIEFRQSREFIVGRPLRGDP